MTRSSKFLRSLMASLFCAAAAIGIALGASAVQEEPVIAAVSVETVDTARLEKITTLISDAEQKQSLMSGPCEESCAQDSDCEDACFDGGQCEANGTCSCNSVGGSHFACPGLAPGLPPFCGGPECTNFVQDCNAYCGYPPGAPSGGQCSPVKCCMC